MQKKNKIAIGIIVSLLFILSVYVVNKGIVYIDGNDNATTLFTPRDSAILAINNNKVYKQEYLIHLKKEIALTYNHFYLKFKAENHPLFWTTTYGNIRPIDYLKDKTNKRLINSKIIHLLASENKVIRAFDFNEFVTQWKFYNKKRKVKHDSGGVVYGSITLGKSEYYDYLINNLKIRLEEKLKNEKFAPGEIELREYFDEIKHEKFQYAETIEIEQFGFPYDEFSYKTATEEIKSIDINSLDELSFCCKLKKRYPEALYTTRVFYDSIPIYGEDNPDQMLKDTALELEYGKSKIIRTQEGIYIVRLKNRLIKKYRPFDEVKDEVLWNYQKEKYDEFIKEQQNNVVITFNDPIYDYISVQDFK